MIGCLLQVKTVELWVFHHRFWPKQMGKTDAVPQRFRRKPRGHGSSSGSVERSSLSSHSLLGNNLLDSTNIPSDEVVSPKNTEHTPDLTATNGTCDPEETPSPDETAAHVLPLTSGIGMETMEPATHTDPDRPRNPCLSSHLPAELSGMARSDIAPLCSNRSLALSACTVSTEDTFLLILFVSNSSDSDVQHLLLQLTCTGELEVELRSNSRLL